MEFNGEKIRIYREKKKMTQEQLAEASGISRATLSPLETGKQRSTNVDVLVAIAMALGRKVDDFFVR